MKSLIYLILIYFSLSSAFAVDHTFSYQGELLDGGSPANGTYTIALQAYDAESLGNTIGLASTHTGVQVSNGLFTITDVNLGASIFDGLDMWLEIKVKGPSDVNFTTLSPRHKMKSVPYATTLIDKGATNGQVLTFDNTNGWQPGNIPAGSDNQNLSLSGTTLSITNGTSASFTGWDTNAADDFSGNYNDLSNKPTIPAASPWLTNGAGIDYLSDVSIGTTDATHRLTIKSDTDDNALRLIGSQGIYGYGSKLNFGDSDLVYISEDEDDKMSIFAFDRIAMISSRVGIGTSSPTASAKLQVESTTQGFLPPRMTTAERDAIVSPVNGLTIYNTDSNCNEVYILNAYWDNLCDNMSAVISGGGRIWLDRNLGAANIGDKGDLFQWGRAAEGHEKRDSPTTTTLATSATPFIAASTNWDGWFIKTNSSPFDWLTPSNSNLWQGVNGVNNPCPSGFRLPTTVEWIGEANSWATQNYAGAYLSPLKLPQTASRNLDGTINQGSDGYYWSSTNNALSYSDYIEIFNTSYEVYLGSRASGFAIRCIKD